MLLWRFQVHLVAQYNGFSDIGMGIGILVIGLASVIIGEAIFGSKTIAKATLAVIGGAIIYRLVVTLALACRIFRNRRCEINNSSYCHLCAYSSTVF